MFRKPSILVALIGILGAIVAFHPIVLSGFTRLETDPADARHLNYVLEHGYRWLAREPGHAEFWSPPMFFPEGNTAAYSETLLGVVPFYAPWRIAGLAPDTALQCWVLTVALLNFGAFYALLRVLRLSRFAGAAGSYLFSYGSIRVVQSGHHHLLPHFFTVTAAIALARLFSESPPARRARIGWIALFFASGVAQFYAGFYLAWILSVCLVVTATCALSVRSTRTRIRDLLVGEGGVIALSALVAAAAILPLARHYLAAAALVGYRSVHEVYDLLPTPLSWVNLGPFSWLYGWLGRTPAIVSIPMEWEKRLGLGPATLILVLAGFVASLRRDGIRVLLAALLAMMALTTLVGTKFTLWALVLKFYPGAMAMRAVSRVALVLLIPASIALAFFLDRLVRSRKSVAAAACAAVVVLEQGQTMPSYDKIEARQGSRAVLEAIPPGCRAFYWIQPLGAKPVSESHLDAMWASLASGIPTVNGYSSNLPRGWLALNDNQLHGEHDLGRLRTALAEWLVSEGTTPHDVCLVRRR